MYAIYMFRNAQKSVHRVRYNYSINKAPLQCSLTTSLHRCSQRRCRLYKQMNVYVMYYTVLVDFRQERKRGNRLYERICCMRVNKHAECIKDSLNSAIFKAKQVVSLFVKHPGVDFTRERTLGFTTVMNIILSMGGNSINKEMMDYYKYSNDTPTTSAFCQQRGKLLPEVFAYVLHEFNDACNDTRLYNGYRLLAVDGSTITLATNPNEPSYFIPNHTNVGINQVQLNALYDLSNKTYVDCVIQNRTETDERRAVIEMLKRNTFKEKTLIIADRGYESFNLFEHINRTPNADYLIRVKNACISEISSLPMEELDKEINITLTTLQTNEVKEKGYKWIAGKGRFTKRKECSWDFESIYPMTLRVVRFEIANGVYETIVTSLNRFAFPLKEIKKLYHMRWGVETSFRELKHILGLSNLHCKKQDYAIQEIYAHIIMYNFCERITLAVVILQSDCRKHIYQANFTMGIHICLRFFRSSDYDPPDVVALIGKNILPIREGRQDKRNLKVKGFTPFVYRVA